MSKLNTPNVPCLEQWVEDLWCHCQPVGTSGKECLWKESQNTWELLAPIPRPREGRQTSGAMLWPTSTTEALHSIHGEGALLPNIP